MHNPKNPLIQGADAESILPVFQTAPAPDKENEIFRQDIFYNTDILQQNQMHDFQILQ